MLRHGGAEAIAGPGALKEILALRWAVPHVLHANALATPGRQVYVHIGRSRSLVNLFVCQSVCPAPCQSVGRI